MLIDMRDAFFEELVLQAQLNPNIIILSADHGAFALEEFAKNNHKQYINIGIAEQNMVGVAAGLAASGKIVFIYGITPFVSLRVLEQLTIDVAAMKLPVNVISVGAGFTYSTDGPTHQGIQDVLAISSIPGFTIINCSDPENSKFSVKNAISSGGPHYIRIEKEKLCTLDRVESIELSMRDGFSMIKGIKSTRLVLTTGFQTHRVIEIIKNSNSSKPLEIVQMDLHQLSPITDAVVNQLNVFEKIYIIEESYSSIASNLLKKNSSIKPHLKTLSIDMGQGFIFNGHNRKEVLNATDLSEKSILEFLRDSD